LLAVGLVVLHDLRQRERRDQSEQEREDAEEVHAGIIESAHAGRYPSRSFPGASAFAQTYKSDEHSFRVVEVVKGLEQPWSLAFLPDGRMLVTEKAGRLRMIANGKLEQQPIAGLAARHGARAGRAARRRAASGFPKNSLVYLAYAARGEDGVGTELARGRLANGSLEDVQVLFRQSPKGRTGNHFGGRIVFDRAGYVYLTLGDRGEMPRAQKPDDHAGSVIRLHDDGRVPGDNPFVGKPGWKPEKFDLGPPQPAGRGAPSADRRAVDARARPAGRRRGEHHPPGANYGWPVITYGVNYGIGTKIGEGTAKPGMEQPIHYWVPSIAPSGMAFYTGDRFPRWKGNLFVGALRDQMLVRLQLDGEKVVKESACSRTRSAASATCAWGPTG
jgi:glucose/arabinose dehydrogenase